MQQQQQQHWRTLLLHTHPHISNLVQRIDPVHRAVALAHSVQPVSTQVSAHTVTCLIQQHLRLQGLHKTEHILATEAGTSLPPSYVDTPYSLLETALNNRIKTSEDVYRSAVEGYSGDSTKLHFQNTTRHSSPSSLSPTSSSIFEDDHHTESSGKKVQHRVVVADGKLEAASLPALLQRLTDPLETNEKFVETFLLTYPTFVQPSTLASMLEELLEPEHSPGIRRGVLRVVEKWMDGGVWGRTQDVLHLILRLLHAAVVKDSSLAPVSIELKRQAEEYLQRQLEGLQDPWGRETGEEEEEESGGGELGKKVILHDAEQVAKQLTLIQHRIFAAIPIHELLRLDWNSPSTKHKAPNMVHAVNYFNRLSLWLATLIVTPNSFTERAQRVEAAVRIAKSLRRMNNFASLQAVLGALEHQAVFRMKETMAAISDRSIKELEKLRRVMQSDGNFRAYRRLLDTVEPPAIPHLGVCMQDLILIDEGNSDNTNGLINWHKREMVSSVVRQVLQFQQSLYTFPVVHRVQLPLLLMSESISEAELLRRSVERE